jgi:hypothetical protein
MTIPPTFGRPFVLQRDLDLTGVSGTGTVADGIEFPDGTVTVRWRGEHASTVVWGSLADALHVHGHADTTRVVWATADSNAAHAQRAAAAEQRFEVQRQQDTSTDAPWVHAYTEEIEDWKQRAQQAEAERDGAYRERAHLLAWLTTHYPAVMAPALDLDEAGWWLLYITAPTGQLSWHISPRDAGLLTHVQRVEPNDPRVKWDGHATEQKYERVMTLVADLAQRCGPECAEAHTYAGCCELTTTEA